MDKQEEKYKMSKRSPEGRNDKERKKYASLTGFSEKTIHQRLKNLQNYLGKEDWRRGYRCIYHYYSSSNRNDKFDE